MLSGSQRDQSTAQGAGLSGLAPEALVGSSPPLTAPGAKLSLSSLRYGGLFLDPAAGLGRSQRQPGEVGLAQVFGADRVTVGLVEKFLIERGACRSRARGAIRCFSPRLMGCDLSA